MFLFSAARSVSSVAALGFLLFGARGAAGQDPVPPLPSPPAVQQRASAPFTVTGQVRRSGSLKPVAKAIITVEGTSIETTSDADGRFRLTGIPAGRDHIVIAAPGLMPLRAELALTPGGVAPLDVLLDAEVHYTEVVSVSPEARDLFASYQPTSVLAGQDLGRELAATLGETLQGQPGVAQRSLGPGPSRPVIRGLDGDRVLILENGQRVGDLSSQSADHGVPVNPASAGRVEVVRGPATLLYGANAIGGLVNVIDETIPTRPVVGAHGTVLLDFASNAREADAATAVSVGNGRWAAHVGASGKRNGDVRTPEGTIPNTQARAGFGNVGLAWTGTNGFIGGSYGYDDTRYGIPFVEEGQVELTPRRHVVVAKAEFSQLPGLIAGIRADVAARRYQHDEIVGGEAGTHFSNDTDELNLFLRQRPAGRLTGTIGAWAMNRRFAAEGEEALAPPVAEKGFAAFVYEELTWPHFTFQFGARVNHVSFDPEQDLRARTFTDGSGSVGLLFRPAAAADRLIIAVNLARASRSPALEELYFFGPHPGNFAFEIGNAGLQSERAFGLDAAVRWRTSRASGEVTVFRNSIDEYIFRNPVGAADLAGRYPDLDDVEFPVIEFTAADSVLQGVEAHTDIHLPRDLTLELGADYVRGELRETGEPLPRIPPFRGRIGLTYHHNALQMGAQLVAVSRQDRVFGEETATGGYGVLKLFGAYSFVTGAVTNTVTARLDNATDRLYRNHLSLIKDAVPEMGRNFKLIYSIRF